MLQNFAINGGGLNGDSIVWIDEVATAAIVMQASGEVMRGASVEGNSQIVVSAILEPALQVKITGDADIALQAAGEVQRGATIEGNAPIQIYAEGELTRRVMLESLAAIEIYGTGDIQAVPAISSTFTIEFRASGDIHVATAQQLEGLAQIEVASNLNAWSVKPTMLEGAAQIEMASIGYGSLVIQSPPAIAQIMVAAGGDAMLGKKVDLAGDAVIGLFARGSLSKFTYVFIEGGAAIEIKASAAVSGKPPIPTEYDPAPKARTIRIGREARERELARENRSVA